MKQSHMKTVRGNNHRIIPTPFRKTETGTVKRVKPKRKPGEIEELTKKARINAFMPENLI